MRSKPGCFLLSLRLLVAKSAAPCKASKLCLVDLAGSERVSKTRSEGLVLKEAGHINRSLALLEQVNARPWAWARVVLQYLHDVHSAS
jgi:hypothetical protein